MSGNAHPHSLPFLTKQQQEQQQQQQQQIPSQPSTTSSSQRYGNSSDPHLPQGECTFLKPQAGRTPQRCECVAFTLDEDKPGTVCGCGHQAWTHVRNHVGEGVSNEEFANLVQQVKELRVVAKQLHDEQTRQRQQRDKENSQIVGEFRKLFDTVAKVKTMSEHRTVTSHAGMEQRITQVASHATHLEDRIEAVVDKTQNWDQVVEKVNLLDEACMRLEERVGIDGLEASTPSSRSAHMLSPVHEVSSSSTSPMTVGKVVDMPNAPPPWKVRVVLLPKKTQRFGFTHDSVAWRRSYSRSLHQDVTASSHAPEDFVRAVDGTFKSVLQNRPWAPLVCLRSENKELSQLPLGQDQPRLWDYAFLEKHCFAHDKLDGDTVYIAPVQEELSWAFIKSLPPVAGADETCWEHNIELDGFVSLNFSRPQSRAPGVPQRSPFRPHQTEMLPPIDAYIKGENNTSNIFRKTSIDTDSSSMYENSPPPYSTRIHQPAGAGMQPTDSRLGILALTALQREGPGHHSNSSIASSTTVVNDRPPAQHVFDVRPTPPRPSTSAGPGERTPIGQAPHMLPPPLPSTEMDIDYDSPTLSLSRSTSGSTSHSVPAPAPPQQLYYSGRSKRKVSASKYKEPVGLNISDVKLPRLGFHKRDSGEGDKGKAHADVGGDQSRPA